MATLSFFNFHHRLDLPRVGSTSSSQVVICLFITYRLGQQVDSSIFITYAQMVPAPERCPAGYSAHQKVRYTTAGEPTTDLTRVLPDHRCVMTDAYPGTLPGVICRLFFDPLICNFHRCTSPLFFGRDPPAKYMNFGLNHII